jgi:Ca2+/Na+ antiporter
MFARYVVYVVYILKHARHKCKHAHMHQQRQTKSDNHSLTKAILCASSLRTDFFHHLVNVYSITGAYSLITRSTQTPLEYGLTIGK